MSERWLPVPGFEGRYEVSDMGSVRSVRSGRILKAWVENHYLRVGLSLNGKVKFHNVHRLVLLAFVGPPPVDHEGCHGDGNSTNNRLNNLRWDTRSANMRDQIAHGHHINARKTHCSQGHPYSPDNTYVSPAGGRQCIACIASRKQQRKAYAARRWATDPEFRARRTQYQRERKARQLTTSPGELR